ncbi:MAG: hypothetical protein E7052_07765 [Lentisphaerae bacterium]|nr:hypothetical protein [Lentisphaerota bacterium]
MKMITKILNWFFFRKKRDYSLLQAVEAKRGGRPVSVHYMTKPLQYMNMKAIPLDPDYCNVLIVTNHFIDAEKFTAFLQKSDTAWDVITLLPHEDNALASTLLLPEVVEFWTPADYGVKFNFFLKELHQRHCKIKMIEEGIGNYVRSDMGFAHWHPFLARHRWLSKLTFELAREIAHFLSGSGSGLNLSKWTDELHLYYPQYPAIPCRERSVLRQLPLTPTENFQQLDKFFDFSEYEWIAELQNKKILIMPTDWSGEAKFDQNDLSGYDVLIVKYHPHLKDRSSRCEAQIAYMAGNLPTEILIFRLLNQHCQVTLRGKFTSSLVYLLDTPVKLEFEDGDIPDFMRDYFKFVTDEGIKNV